MLNFQLFNDLKFIETIQYESGLCKYGPLSIAYIRDGLLNCHFMAKDPFLGQLKNEFPNIHLTETNTSYFSSVLQFIEGTAETSLNLIIRGTPFQLDIWKNIVNIKKGQTISYKKLAERSGYPNAIRAVGAAVGANSFAFLIPCHRILYSNGKTGHYRWGNGLKIKILEDEIPGLKLQYSKTLFDEGDQ
ncbi:MAG: MGMT family protein [Saprospiraceae bacterium]|nr:MGMT family protein [Candidatus Vicinibacter affinis]